MVKRHLRSQPKAVVGHYVFRFGGFVKEAILSLHSDRCFADCSIDIKSSCAFVPQRQPKEEKNIFQITTNFPVILGIFQKIEKNFRCIIDFLSENAVPHKIVGLILPLCNNTALRLALLDSMNNLE